MTRTATREDQWVSIAKAAKDLDIHPRTLRRYINQGRLDVQRLSPQVVRIKPEDLRAFLVANVKVNTGTGNCYVPRPEREKRGSKLPPPRVGSRLQGV